MALAYFSWERQRHGYHENLVLNYSPLLNKIIEIACSCYRLKIIIMNQSHEKRKQTEKTYQIGEFMLLLKCIYSLDNTGVNRCVSSFHYHIASIHQSRVFKTNQHLPKLHTGFSQLTFHCQLLLS